MAGTTAFVRVLLGGCVVAVVAVVARAKVEIARSRRRPVIRTGGADRRGPHLLEPPPPLKSCPNYFGHGA